MLYRFLIVCSCFASVLLSGCKPDVRDSPANNATLAAMYTQDVAERDSVLALVNQTNSEAFKEAFLALRGYNYTRYSRTDQFEDDDFLVAFRERTVNHFGPVDDRQYNILEADSTSDFDFGFFRRFVSTTVEEQDPGDLTPYLFPADPGYLSDRNFEAYLYRFQQDTLMLDIAARVAEIRAKPVDGDGKNIRRAKFFFDQASGQFVAFELERIDLALFFREESRFFVHLQNAPDGKLVPYNTRIETRIIMPFTPPQIFRTVATYTDLQL